MQRRSSFAKEISMTRQTPSPIGNSHALSSIEKVQFSAFWVAAFSIRELVGR
jgi:hypothetical protein